MNFDLVLKDTGYWEIRPKAKLKDVPADALPAFLGPDGTPYSAWRQIRDGNWQPRVAFLEGRFWRITWAGSEATRVEAPAGWWLVCDSSGGVFALPPGDSDELARVLKLAEERSNVSE